MQLVSKTVLANSKQLPIECMLGTLLMRTTEQQKSRNKDNTAADCKTRSNRLKE